jgi:hypothetical protein
MTDLLKQSDLCDLNPTAKIALLYFGIIRSIRYSSASHAKYIHNTFSRLSSLDICGHFINQDSINNVRTGEKCVIDRQSARLIGIKEPIFLDNYELKVDQILSSISVYGDIAWDQHLTTKNLIKQLISLESAAHWALNNNYNIVIFSRTDLLFLDSILNGINTDELRSVNNTPRVYLPAWGGWGGYNDRFAICVGADAIRAYGHRIRLISEFCHMNCCPLHAERLLAYALKSARISVLPLRVRANRIRETRVLVDENFSERQSDWKYNQFRLLRFARRVKLAFSTRLE